MSQFSEAVAEAVHKLDKLGLGSVFYLRTSIISRGITTGIYRFTSPAAGYSALEDVIIRSNSVGLAGGSSIKIVVTGNSIGTDVVLTEGVPFLGAYRTTDLASAQARMQTLDAGKSTNRSEQAAATIVEPGAQIGVRATETACTGTGEVEISIKFRRLSENSKIVLGNL